MRFEQTTMRPPGLFAVVITAVLLPASAGAQSAREERTPSDFARQFENPLPDLMNVRFINDVDFGIGEEGDSEVLLRINALLPVRLTSKVNLFVNTVVPLHSRPSAGGQEERVNGVGDMLQRLLLGPTRAGRFLWALGPAFELPTATRRALGSDKLSIGPSVALSYQSPSWSLSLSGWHLRSVTGKEAGGIVERTHLLPVLAHTFPSGVTLEVGSEVVYDWSAPSDDRQLSLPLLFMMSRVTKVGDQEVNLVLGGRYYVEAPTGGPAWGLRLAVAFTFDIDREGE